MILQLNVCRKRCSNITHNNRYKCLEDNSEIFTIDVNLCEIIGKPPTLVDVRNWIKTLTSNWVIVSNAYEKLMINWNDSIYLRDQSPELINFLLESKK